MDIKIEVGEVDLSTVIGEHRVYRGDDEYGSDPLTVADAIIAELTDRIVKTDSYSSLRKLVSNARTEVIRERLVPLVDEAIAVPIQPTNTFGENAGQPTTLRALIIAEVREYLKKETGDYNRRSTIVRDLVKSEVEKALKAELVEVIQAEKAKVVEAVRASASTIIADAVKAGLR